MHTEINLSTLRFRQLGGLDLNKIVALGSPHGELLCSSALGRMYPFTHALHSDIS